MNIKTSWNAGLTKESDERMMNIAKKNTGKFVSQETCQKLSKVLKGKLRSEETKLRMSISAKKRAPRVFSEQARENMRKAQANKVGVKHTEEMKKRLSELAKLRPKMSLETREKISKSLTGKVGVNTGRILSKLWRENLSKAKRGKKQSDYTILKRANTIRKTHNTIEYKMKMSDINKQRFQNMTTEERTSFMKNITKKGQTLPNLFETRCMHEFKKHGIELEYCGDGRFSINGKFPDFVNVEQKIIVEVYYKFWKIKKYQSLENYQNIRKQHFSGWKVFFLECDDLQNVNKFYELKQLFKTEVQNECI